MSFWSQVPWHVYRALMSRSIFSWNVRTELQLEKNGSRISQFRLATAELSLASTLLALLLFAWVCMAVPSLCRPLVELLRDGDLVYFLAENRLQGVLLGYAFGVISVALFGRVWLPLAMTIYALSSGILALNVGWGVWMGVLPGIWIFQLIRSHRGPWRRWILWKLLLSLGVFAVTFIFSDLFSNLIRSQFQTSTFIESRVYQWFLCGGFSLILGLGLSATFFHIYFWLFGQKR